MFLFIPDFLPAFSENCNDASHNNECLLQRMGAVHGEELPYVLGAPLVDGFGHFPQNYTKSEVALSESIMLFLANFVKTG